MAENAWNDTMVKKYLPSLGLLRQCSYMDNNISWLSLCSRHDKKPTFVKTDDQCFESIETAILKLFLPKYSTPRAIIVSYNLHEIK